MTEKQPQVLIAEDNRTMRLMVRKCLEEAGCIVTEAENGLKALEMAPQLHPDLILLDVEMPEMDGLTACAELRKLADIRYTPIMMVTSHNDPISIQKAFDAGATEFTVKPINWDILGHRVHYLVRNGQLFQELQKSNAELQEAHEQLENLFLNMHDGVLSTNMQGKIITFNPAAASILNIPIEKALNCSIATLFITDPINDAFNKIMSQALDETRLTQKEKVQFYDGSTIKHLQISTTFLTKKTWDKEEKYGVIMVFADVTELQMAREEVEKRVVERTQQLRKTAEELQTTLDSLKVAQTHLIESEKTAMLGDLLENIARETEGPINTSIEAIVFLKTGLDQIRTNIEQKTLTQTQLNDYIESCDKVVSKTQNNLKRMANLIKNIKQLTIDKVTEAKIRVPMKQHLHESLTALEPVLKKTNLKININCPDNLELTTYSGSLFRIFMTLVTNSILHAFEPNQEGLINLDIITQDNNVIMTYNDNGKGIPEHNISKIFDPFFSTKEDTEHVGLGLYLLYNQVTRILGGSIICESQEGKGTTFIITLPKT